MQIDSRNQKNDTKLVFIFSLKLMKLITCEKNIPKVRERIKKTSEIGMTR